MASPPWELKWVPHAVLLMLLLLLPRCCLGQNGTPLQYNLTEEKPPDTPVANLTRDSGIDRIYSASEILEMQFSFSPPSGMFSDYFSLDHRYGIIRTNQIIDRDKIPECSNSITCPIEMKIIVMPLKFFQIIKATVFILDKNDNAPSFGRDNIKISVSENAMPSTRFGVPNAEDLDSGVNGLKSYSLVPSDGPFGLDMTDATDGSIDLNLVLNQRLDRESVSEYHVTIYAVDGGNPALSGSTRVTISVTDANDNNPQFDNYTYVVSLQEDTPALTTFLKVHAEDPDEGRNGEVVYGLADTSLRDYGHLFGIRNDTGEMYLKMRLEYDKGSEYHVSVKAEDLGPNSLPQYARVIISLEDINDHAPEIIINTLTETEHAQISEEAQIGMFVAHVSVEDPDEGPSGEVNCTLDDEYFELNQIYMTEYTILTKVVFDRETKEEYHINLVCFDKGRPPLTSTKYLPIIVVDLNDHTPEFLQSSYNSTVSENMPKGVSLLRVSAIDGDIGRNAAIKYKIGKEDDLSYVEIDPINGVVKTAGGLDYEEQEVLHIQILAIDQGVIPNTATTTLQLFVSDTDDEPPEFSWSYYQLSVEENLPIKTKIGAVAVKSDTKIPGLIHYSLIVESFWKQENSSSDDDALIIDEDTGMIYTGQTLDRETTDVYNFTVIAVNKALPGLNTTVSVTVLVTDHNDNAPIILYPEGDSQPFQISSDTPKGTMIFAINATDLDHGENSTLQYNMISVTNENVFEVDSETGEVWVVENLDGMSEGYMTLEVQDHGKPSLSSRINVTFIINDTLPYLTLHSMWNTTNLFSIGIAGAVFLITLMILISLAVIKKQKEKAAIKRTYNCRVQAEKVVISPPPSSQHSQPEEAPKERRHLTEHQQFLMDNGSYIVMGDSLQLGVDIGETSTDDATLWTQHDLAHTNLSPKVHSSVLSKPSPTSSDSGLSQTSRIRDSGVDLSWTQYDVTQHGQIWSIPHGSVPHQADDIRPNIVHLRPQTTLASASQHPHSSRSATPLTEIEMQVHDMLHMLQKDRDSETGSFTDSGKGPSEEGDNFQRVSPLEPQYADVRQANKQEIPHVVEAHAMAMQDRKERAHHSARHQREQSIPEELEYGCHGDTTLAHNETVHNLEARHPGQELEEYMESPRARIPRHFSDSIPSKTQNLSIPRRLSDSVTDRVTLPDFADQKLSNMTKTVNNLSEDTEYPKSLLKHKTQKTHAHKEMPKFEDSIQYQDNVADIHINQARRSSPESVEYLPEVPAHVEYVNLPLGGQWSRPPSVECHNRPSQHSNRGYHSKSNRNNDNDEEYVGYPDEHYVHHNPVYADLAHKAHAREGPAYPRNVNVNNGNYEDLHKNSERSEDHAGKHTEQRERNRNLYVDHRHMSKAYSAVVGDIGYHSRDNSQDSQRTVIIKGNREKNQIHNDVLYENYKDNANGNHDTTLVYGNHRNRFSNQDNDINSSSGNITNRTFHRENEQNRGRIKSHGREYDKQRDRSRSAGRHRDNSNSYYGNESKKKHKIYDGCEDNNPYGLVEMVVKDVIEKYIPSERSRRNIREDESATSATSGDCFSDGETTTSGSYVVDPDSFPSIKKGDIMGRDYMIV